MKGMELSRRYFDEYGLPMLKQKFPQYIDKMAAGLAGEGSECLGFDDEYSQDHDFGAGFCIWLPDDLYRSIGEEIQKEYDRLPETYMGISRNITAMNPGRTGAMSTEDFYFRYTGLRRAPQDNMEWFRIPEHFLATVTNGQVFMDRLGQFTDIRTALLGYYPEDVLRKKLAARCAVMAQAGQYNYPRCIKRGERSAAYLACAEFIKAALSAVYLLNHRYMPFYKWSFRGTDELPLLKNAASALRKLSLTDDAGAHDTAKQDLIESICIDVIREMNRQHLTYVTETFMEAQALDLMKGVSDTRISSMHILAD